MAKVKIPRSVVLPVPPDPAPVVHEYGLPDVLSSFGRDRVSLKTLMKGLGIRDSVVAYNFLHSMDRIPASMTQEQFENIYQELMA